MSEMRLPLVRPHVGVLGATVREYVGASILETRAGNPWWIPSIEVSRMCGSGHRGLRRRHAFKTSARNRARWALGRPRVRILHTCNNPLNSEKALSIRGVTHGSGRNQPFRRAGGRVRGRRRSIGFAEDALEATNFQTIRAMSATGINKEHPLVAQSFPPFLPRGGDGGRALPRRCRAVGRPQCEHLADRRTCLRPAA